ncbi:hypothetical protein TRFO_43278 [Tritrichomonas foetus]|uniref:Uncharacterized protein n=1 Tax=Tritrichomonas foetus TaxID=1144522 RepID=A0A1J4KW24_9EUKA|nr:hypothetical protein TRFO_43278 [Tritrichomonas foetus]|eukprot:OHT13709.1 hypothetical protein TRFO_43278 [Tritrichomonas foetus]
MSDNLSKLIQEADQKRNAIDQHGRELRADLEAQKAFNLETAKNTLSNDLNQIQSFIIDLSKSCLNQLNDWNNSLVGMDAEINEVSGLIQRIKSDVGTKALGPLLVEGSAYVQQQPDLAGQQSLLYNFPDFPFDINTRALDNVGHQVEDVNAGSTALQPLVKKIESGKQPPMFWCTQQDYFSPEIGQNVAAEAYKTSFSSFFEFDPVPQPPSRQGSLANFKL